MNKWKIVGFLLLSLILTTTFACSGDNGNTSQQLSDVIKGDLMVTVSGSGKAAVSQEALLTFGSGGRVDKIYVKEGDIVNKDTVLASLDTSVLELAVKQAQITLAQAQVALTQADLSKQSAQLALDAVNDSQKTLELALLNAQIGTKTAEYSLDVAKDVYTWPDIDDAQSDVDNAKSFLDYALQGLNDATTANSIDRWIATVANAQVNLTTAEAKLDAQVQGYDTEEVVIKELQLDAAQQAEAQAQKNLDDLSKQINIKEKQLNLAEQSLAQAQSSVEFAEQSLQEAQKQLDEATIIAPFDGVIAGVNAKEDSMVPSPSMSPQPVIYMVNLSSMEMDIQVDEIDIPDVEIGQEAIIELDALPDMAIKGTVTSIYPVPTEVGGIVLYDVKMNFDVPDASGIKVGMSASADIIINSRENVLLVPERAIYMNGKGETAVSISTNGQTEERTVVTGASDGLQTEIVSGLHEGETIAIETRPASGTSGGLF